MNEINELIEMLKSSDASYLIAKFEEYSVIITDNATANVLEDTLKEWWLEVFIRDNCYHYLKDNRCIIHR